MMANVVSNKYKILLKRDFLGATGSLVSAWLDASSYGNNAPQPTVIKQPTSTINAAGFDGVNDNLIIPFIDIFTSDFTIHCWVRVANNLENYIWSDWSGAVSFRFSVEGNRVVFDARNSSGVPICTVQGAVGSIPSSLWKLVSYSWDRVNKTSKIYINGVFHTAITTVNSNVDIRNNNRATNIGWKQDSSLYFNGELNDFAVISKLENQADITNYYLSTKTKYGL